jgi:hypothetical protein
MFHQDNSVRRKTKKVRHALVNLDRQTESYSVNK